MPTGRPRITVTLSVGASALVLKRCAEMGDEPANYVDNLVRLDHDEAVGYFDGAAEEFEADLALVAGEMGRDPQIAAELDQLRVLYDAAVEARTGLPK